MSIGEENNPHSQQDRLNSLEYVITVGFNDPAVHSMSKENFVVNITVSMQWTCPEDFFVDKPRTTDYYYEEPVQETQRRTVYKTIVQTDGYKLRWILVLVIPIVVALILLLLTCIFFKSIKAQQKEQTASKAASEHRSEEIKAQKDAQMKLITQRNKLKKE